MVRKKPLQGREPLEPWRVQSERMREARAARKLRQIDVVFLAGLTHATVSKLENGHHANLTLESLGALCDVLDVSADWLCGKSERRQRSK